MTGGWIRTIVAISGIAGAGGVALLNGAQTEGVSVSATPAGSQQQHELCLRAALPFFDGVGPGCYTTDEIRAFADLPVVGSGGEETTVMLSHPTDADAAPYDCATCRVYREMRYEGWYALTSRDMRREAYFVRACRLIEMLGDARPAEISYFGDGEASFDDIESVAAMAMIGVAADASDASAAPEVIAGGDGEWRLVRGDATTVLQELSAADFDGDSIEDILVFAASAPVEGTARAVAVGLLRKIAADGEALFSPIP